MIEKNLGSISFKQIKIFQKKQKTAVFGRFFDFWYFFCKNLFIFLTCVRVYFFNLCARSS